MAVNIHNPADIKEVPKELAGAVKLGTAPKEKGLPKKGESQAKFVGDTIGRPVDVDAAGKLTSGLAYIQGLKELQEKNLTLGNVAGLSVAIADKVNGLLKPELDPLTRTQTIEVTQEALDKAWTEAQKDKSFTSLSEKSKVMAKKELDTIMLNLQTKYGNRAPVAEFRAAQAVLSRRTSDPVAFNRTMTEETTGTYRRLNQLGFNKQDIEKMDNKLKELETEAATSAPATSQADVDRVTGLPKINAKGFVLESDGQGTYLYINPKNRNEYEEPEL
jgi:vacuolar-type H+-ATPase subunit I/STV1